MKTKVKLYGVTIIDSEVGFIETLENGSRVYRESVTKTSTNKDEVRKYALSEVKKCFDSFGFEGQPPYRRDYNGIHLKEHKAEIENFHDTCIQGSDSHYRFEFFTQEVDIDVPDKNEKPAVKGRPRRIQKIDVETPKGAIHVESKGAMSSYPGVHITTQVDGCEELVACVEYDTESECFRVTGYNYGQDTPCSNFDPESGEEY